MLRLASGYPARTPQGQCSDWLVAILPGVWRYRFSAQNGWWLPCQAYGATGSVLRLAGGYPARRMALQVQCSDWLVATLPGVWRYRFSAQTGWWLSCQAYGATGSVLRLAGGYPARRMALQVQCSDWLVATLPGVWLYRVSAQTGWWLSCQASGDIGSVLRLADGYPARRLVV